MTKPKRILIATGIYPPDIGGPATYTKLLEEELPQRGFVVTVANFAVYRRIWPKGLSHLFYFCRLLFYLPVNDIIYVQDPVSVGWPTYLACCLGRRKYYLKIVGDYAWEQGRQRFGVKDLLDDFATKPPQTYSWPVALLKKIETWVAKGATGIIVPSNYLKKIVSAWGVNPEKITVIYNAFAGVPNLAYYHQTDWRQTLGLSGQIMVSVGRLVPWKGFANLIEAIARLRDNFPQLQLLIIGSGPEQSALENLIIEQGLTDRVRLLGEMPRNELFKYLATADIFVLNTSYEGFSHQLLEVLTFGLPILTTNIGGNPELIESGYNGLLVPPDDRQALVENIGRLLTDRVLARQLAEHGIVSVKKFSQQAMLNSLANYFSTCAC